MGLYRHIGCAIAGVFVTTFLGRYFSRFNDRNNYMHITFCLATT